MSDSTPSRLLVTAGPTHEPIDAVRYLANRSSGRLGLALADVAARRGHDVTLLLGPTPLAPPTHSHLAVHRFQTTAELQALLERHAPGHDVVVMAAAVADYRPAPGAAAAKLPRGDAPLVLELEPTPDLVAGLAATARPDQTIVGFALEPAGRLPEAARAKLARKGLDAIVANPLETMEAGTIDALLLLADGTHLAPGGPRPKADFAAWLLDRLPEIRAAATRRAG